MKYIFVLIIVCQLFIFQGIGAQETIPDIKEVNIDADSVPALHVIHKVEKDKIVLRWAPTSPISWYEGRKYGYKIERIKNPYGSTEMDTFVTVAAKVLPWPIEKWNKADIEKYDDYNLIAGELMYGESSEKAKSGKIFDMADDFESRYTLSMMCADFSGQASEALGVRFEDHDVKPDYVYIYKVTSLVPDSLLSRHKSNLAIAQSSKVDTLIKPEIHHIEQGDRLLHIFWKKETDIFQNYTAFYIEKTLDGKVFTRLQDKPYISSNQFGEAFNEYYIYSDSITHNYTKYGYRIIGISPFADLSPPSDVVYSMGRDMTPPITPFIVSSTTENGKIEINWEYPEGGEKLRGFYVGRSHNPYDGFENITPEILDIESRSFVDNLPSQNRPNFYIVSAIDTSGNYSISPAHYVHVIDSIPPSPPVYVKAEAFINGNVTLTWNKNPEQDISGYEIHSAYHPDHVFIKVTNHQIKDTLYTDTVMLETLTEKVYYKIVALDKNYNYSSYSEMIVVSLPDIVPPSSPIVNDFLSDEKSIQIFWINSSSKDVVKQIVYRRESSELDWEIVFQTNDIKIQQFSDTMALPSKAYYYKVHAIDDANNMSKESTSIKVISKISKFDYSDLNLKIVKQNDKLILSWDKMPDIKYYTLYKTNPDGKFITLGNTTENSYLDIPENRSLKYAIRATTINGILHKFSEPVRFNSF